VIVQPPAAPAAAPKAAGVDPMAVQLSLWESVRTSQDPADFEDYLKQYPDGKFAAVARRRLAALKTASLKEREPVAQPTPAAPARPTPEIDRPPSKTPPVPSPPAVSKPLPQQLAAFEVMMQGTATNLTVGTSAQTQFQLRRNGDGLTAAIRVFPPLFATGVLQGQYRDGQCMLQGRMNEGFILKMIGTCSSSGFSGQYQAEAPGQVQQGIFRLQSVASN
jgi:hypothetical protein